MQSLASIIADVRSGRRPPWPCHPNPRAFDAEAWLASPALSEIKHFGSNPGNLRMLKYVPKKLRYGAPLVVLLHGCGQTARDITSGTGWWKLAKEQGFALLIPEQRLSNNAQRGFNWFLPGDTARGRGEAASIRQMIGLMVERFHLHPRKIYVTGLSAGGAMATALLSIYPDVFAAGAIIAGLPFGIASSLIGALAAMAGKVRLSGAELGDKVRAASQHRGSWPRLSIWHGCNDTTVAPLNADGIARQWCDLHGVYEIEGVSRLLAGGHLRQSWYNAAGVTVIERVTVEGLGHAVPIDHRRDWRGYGAIPPFFEDVGMSATREIARFWGLADSQPLHWHRASSRSAHVRAQ